MGAHNGKEEASLQNLHADHLDNFIPIQGYETMPLVSLELAVEPLVSLLPAIQTYVHLAKQKCQNPADGLTRDQSTSIMLYTIRWQPLDRCLSFALNTTLKSTDRQNLKPWFLYLKLLLTALLRLPSIPRTVYRGIRLDVSEHYPKDRTIVWSDFSLCTNSFDKNLAKKSSRTIFSIECNSSKDISKHSFYPSQGLILLLAGTRFKVIQCVTQKTNLHWIQLKEVQSPFTLLQSVELSRDLTPPSRTIQSWNYTYEHNHNRKLEELISKYQLNSQIQLRIDQISDLDMKIIVQQAIIDKKCTELWLYNARISSSGALILSNGLYNNKSLKKLYLNDNCIHDQGVHSLVRVLSINNSTLKELYLARNGITNTGAQYLAEMLNTNRTLITLCLYGNQIADDGIKYLTHVLTYYNTTLENLYLSGNNLMTDLSIDYFIDMVKQNRSLKKLHLFNCNLSEIGKTKLREIVQTKENFTLNI